MNDKIYRTLNKKINNLRSVTYKDTTIVINTTDIRDTPYQLPIATPEYRM
jgi:hypothetical protein